MSTQPGSVRPAHRRCRVSLNLGQGLGLGLVPALLCTLAAAAPVAGVEGEHVHITQAGDTLIGLGRHYLSDPRQWPQLQRLNRVHDPRRLPIGHGLRIPLRLMRVEPAPAAVLAASAGVRSAGAAVVAGQSLPAGSAVSTDADANLTLRLVDGTLLRLRGDSRVLLQGSVRLPVAGEVRAGVRMEQGRAEVQAKPARAGRPGFRIDTPQGVLAVRGTEYRVWVDGQRTVSEVLDGVVALSSAGDAGPGTGTGTGTGTGSGATAVPAGFGARIDSRGRVDAPRPLLPAPDLGVQPARHERPLVRLRLPPQPLAHGWRVQVAPDERFDVLLADVRAATPELRIAGLPDGRFAMRVRMIDAQGVEGRDAVGTLTLKARPEPPLLRAPAPAAVLRGDGVDFAWTASSEAASYRLQLAHAVAGDAFAAPLVELKDLRTPAHRLQRLAPGNYVWRVAASRADGDAGPFGDAQAFELRPPPAPAPAPRASLLPGAEGVQLSWAAGLAGAPGRRFELQLARDAGFAQPLTTTTVDTGRVQPTLPGPGRYYVRLRALEADGFVGPWSATQYFDLPDCVRDGASSCVRVEGGLLQRP